MDKDRIERIIDLREKGMGYRAIALETGLTMGQAGQILQNSRIP